MVLLFFRNSRNVLVGNVRRGHFAIQGDIFQNKLHGAAERYAKPVDYR